MTTPDDATAKQSSTDDANVIRVAPDMTERRFAPGTMLLNRYRVISLLGRGGMAEVYRAEDVKLGQQVALKFVPREFARDAKALQHLYSEARIGRDVAHPNVCRLYDIVEYAGDHFIAMQYVDGEDLASLLRRIGRLPVEKAIDIARDLCAGLAAAHDKGVIHRDLKPANVMIDGKGRAHIADFGLAVIATDPQGRAIAGTPAYMAPEQLSGQRVTPATDLYALGLIIYEVLTGRRLFEPGPLPQISSQHLQPKPRITSTVRDVPAQIEAIVMECLEEDPALRPRSARAVLAALPGGDPLEAAVAAGETPSPEMVAAATKSGELPAWFAISGIALFVIFLIAIAALNPRTRLFSPERLRKSPEALSDRAEEIVHAIGFADDPVDHAGFYIDRSRELRRTIADRDRLGYVYRRSPTFLSPYSSTVEISRNDPPLTYPRMANIELTGDGRLRSLVIVPDAATRSAPHAIDDLFRASGFDRSLFREVSPRELPPVGCDQRMAWDGPAHIEAASFAGAIVWFAVDPARVPLPPSNVSGIGGIVFNAVFIGTLIASIGFTMRNAIARRLDLRGGFRAAGVSAVVAFFSVIFGGHLTRAGIGREVPNVLSQGLLDGAVFLIMYLAAEPYVRRKWPAVLISWQRLMDGRWRDSLVAREVAIGILFGGFSAVQNRLFTLLAGQGPPQTPAPFLISAGSLSGAASWMLHVVPEGISYAIAAVFTVMLGRVFLKRPLIYIPFFTLLLAIAMAPQTGSKAFDIAAGVCGAIALMIAVHEGMLMVATAWSVYHLFDGLPMTLDFSTWYAGRGTFAALLLLAICGFAFSQTVQRGKRLATAAATA